MSCNGEGAHRVTVAARSEEFGDLISRTVGAPITIANEFADVEVRRVDTRNGSRLLICSPKSGQWISLDALETEALTWQNARTLGAMVGNINAPLLPEPDSGS